MNNQIYSIQLISRPCNNKKIDTSKMMTSLQVDPNNGRACFVYDTYDVNGNPNWPIGQATLIDNTSIAKIITKAKESASKSMLKTQQNSLENEHDIAAAITQSQKTEMYLNMLSWACRVQKCLVAKEREWAERSVTPEKRQNSDSDSDDISPILVPPPPQDQEGKEERGQSMERRLEFADVPRQWNNDDPNEESTDDGEGSDDDSLDGIPLAQGRYYEHMSPRQHPGNNQGEHGSSPTSALRELLSDSDDDMNRVQCAQPLSELSDSMPPLTQS